MIAISISETTQTCQLPSPTCHQIHLDSDPCLHLSYLKRAPTASLLFKLSGITWEMGINDSTLLAGAPCQWQYVIKLFYDQVVTIFDLGASRYLFTPSYSHRVLSNYNDLPIFRFRKVLRTVRQNVTMCDVVLNGLSGIVAE
jgi:hypothetical protein